MDAHEREVLEAKLVEQALAIEELSKQLKHVETDNDELVGKVQVHRKTAQDAQREAEREKKRVLLLEEEVTKLTMLKAEVRRLKALEEAAGLVEVLRYNCGWVGVLMCVCVCVGRGESVCVGVYQPCLLHIRCIYITTRCHMHATHSMFACTTTITLIMHHYPHYVTPPPSPSSHRSENEQLRKNASRPPSTDVHQHPPPPLAGHTNATGQHPHQHPQYDAHALQAATAAVQAAVDRGDVGALTQAAHVLVGMVGGVEAAVVAATQVCGGGLGGGWGGGGGGGGVSACVYSWVCMFLFSPEMYILPHIFHPTHTTNTHHQHLPRSVTRQRQSCRK